MNAPLPSRIARAVAGAFGRRLRPLPKEAVAALPFELLARRKDLWVALLLRAMQLTGRGARQPSLKRRPPEGAAKWRGERRPDKVEAIARHVENPCFYGKLNYRRSDPRLELARDVVADANGSVA